MKNLLSSSKIFYGGSQDLGFIWDVLMTRLCRLRVLGPVVVRFIRRPFREIAPPIGFPNFENLKISLKSLGRNFNQRRKIFPVTV